MSPLAEYFARKVAKPMRWEIGETEYEVEFITAVEDTLTAAVTKFVNDPYQSRPARKYVGEAEMVVGRSESRQDFLDRLVVYCDGSWEGRHSVPPRVRAALDAIAADSETEEDDIEDEEDGEQVDWAFPFPRDAALRDKVLTAMEMGYRDVDGQDMLRKMMDLDPSDPDLWLESALRARTPERCLRDAGMALRLAWSDLDQSLLLPPANLSLVLGGASCIPTAMAYRATALYAMGAVEEAFDTASTHMGLDHRDGMGMRYWHAALASLVGDREALLGCKTRFSNPKFKGDALSEWSLALVLASLGEDYGEVMERAAASNPHAAATLVQGDGNWRGMWRVAYSHGSPEEATWIAMLHRDAWAKLGELSAMLAPVLGESSAASPG